MTCPARPLRAAPAVAWERPKRRAKAAVSALIATPLLTTPTPLLVEGVGRPEPATLADRVSSGMGFLRRWRERRERGRARARLLAERRRHARTHQDGSRRIYLYDPIEDDSELVDVLRRADELAEERLRVDEGRTPDEFGYGYHFDRKKQDILLRKFEIVWFTDEEMNPEIIFD